MGEVRWLSMNVHSHCWLKGPQLVHTSLCLYAWTRTLHTASGLNPSIHFGQRHCCQWETEKWKHLCFGASSVYFDCSWTPEVGLIRDMCFQFSLLLQLMSNWLQDTRVRPPGPIAPTMLWTDYRCLSELIQVQACQKNYSLHRKVDKWW